MVNETILGALNSALERGESLKKAMMTVYNAGYGRDEISEAAKIVNERGSVTQPQQVQQSAISEKTKKSKKYLFSKKQKSPKQIISKQSLKQTQPSPTQQPNQTLQQIQPAIQQPAQPLPTQQPTQQAQPVNSAVAQNFYNYGQPAKPKSKTPIILLGFLLLFLTGSLVTIFLFKEDLLSFFSNMFS